MLRSPFPLFSFLKRRPDLADNLTSILEPHADPDDMPRQAVLLALVLVPVARQLDIGNSRGEVGAKAGSLTDVQIVIEAPRRLGVTHHDTKDVSVATLSAHVFRIPPGRWPERRMTDLLHRGMLLQELDHGDGVGVAPPYPGGHVGGIPLERGHITREAIHALVLNGQLALDPRVMPRVGIHHDAGRCRLMLAFSYMYSVWLLTARTCQTCRLLHLKPR